MNPELLALLQRLGPSALKLLGAAGGAPALGGSQIGDAMVSGLNNPTLNAAIAKHLGAPSVPAAPKADMGQLSPQARISQAFRMFDPSASNGVPTMANQNLPTPMDNANAQASAPAGPVSVGGAPPPGAAPAPQAQAPAPMGFFARNSAMMRDPSSGAFIGDPAQAQEADRQASGPGLMQKYMKYFDRKNTN